MISPEMSSSLISMLVFAMVVAEAQTPSSSTPECASKLVPCAAYLNSTNPPPSCCDPLREAVTKELPCLCKLYSTPGLLPSLGVNVTQALRLPTYCKIPGDLSACTTVAKGPSSSPSPPALPSGNDGNGVARMTMMWNSSSLSLSLSLSLIILVLATKAI